MTDRPDHATAAPAHGGDLDRAAARFARRDDWIDLSTGINPWPYPVPALTDAVWRRLPAAAALDDLCAAAAVRYGAPAAGCVTAAPGSQALIHLLPRLRPRCQVAVVEPTYGEHAPAWRAAGHDVVAVAGPDVAECDVIVASNPNNPDGARLSPDALNRVADRLAERGGLLVVDEAFADLAPALSLAGGVDRPGRIVLRSFGKFYGLAGLRLGFALADPATARTIRAALGAWPVSGPAMVIGTAALADADWADKTRRRLDRAGASLRATLSGAGLEIVGGTDLFTLAAGPSAADVFERLGRAGIYVRAFPDHPTWLRFGLPPDPAAAVRLSDALRPA
ncbi:MAG: threonine-phosphate decarboxylase CobD [Alphaproteobacteria bacterium]